VSVHTRSTRAPPHDSGRSQSTCSSPRFDAGMDIANQSAHVAESTAGKSLAVARDLPSRSANAVKRSPTTTGNIERFHHILRADFLSSRASFTNLKVAQQALDEWVDFCNNARRHPEQILRIDKQVDCDRGEHGCEHAGDGGCGCRCVANASLIRHRYRCYAMLKSSLRCFRELGSTARADTLAADLIHELAGDQDIRPARSTVMPRFAANVITGTRHQIAIAEHR
jgi:integrase-like protein